MAQPWKTLEGKVVMVTGASSGLGRELCLDLAGAGCLVLAVARRAHLLRSLCDLINGPDFSKSRPPSSSSSPASGAVRAVAVELDVSGNESSIEPAVRRAWDAFGRIDALVNNAGIRGAVRSSLEWPEEEFMKIILTNQIGLWRVSKHVCRMMRDARVKGSVVNVSSISGLRPSKGDLPYSSSKQAVNAVTMLMALEMGAYGIRVNSICPGLFKSEITRDLMDQDWVRNVARRTIPLRTFGTSDPGFTSLVRYLLHDSSDCVTGNVFVVDAGTNLAGVPIFSSL